MMLKVPIQTENSIPHLSGKEFRFIRLNAGVTLKKIAMNAHRCSRSTVFAWEKQITMKIYQTELLMRLIPPAVFDAGRIAFLENQPQKRRKRARKIN